MALRGILWHRRPVMPQPATRKRDGNAARAEDAGLVFAFRARSAATFTVAAAVLVLAPWPRSWVYVGFAVAFFSFGYIPFVVRRHPAAETIKLTFVALDVLLITASVLNIPAGVVWIDWPIQTRLRGQNFLLLLLLLGEAALTYSPRRVLWTGGWIAGVWSAAFGVLYWHPDSVRYGEILAQGTDEGLLTLFLDPLYVSLPQWLMQLVATVILTVLLATAVYRSRTHLHAQVRSEILRADLARYLSPDIVEALSAPSAPDFGRPATRQVAVLFADIVGFTALTERLSPERTFALLRSFQERSAKAVFRHRGTLDKFLGDGLMATFGALQDEEDAAARAIACAFDLQAEIEGWNRKRLARGAAPITLSVGVHHGTVVAGNIGSRERVEFTAVGDVVNVASRLEHSTREFECEIAVSESCLSAATGHLQSFDRVVHVQVRGRAATVVAHLVDRRTTMAAPEAGLKRLI